MKIRPGEDRYTVTDFSEIEAYKIACKIETDGIRFYTYLFTKSKKAEVKGLFDFLANEERKHLRLFENHLAKLSEGKESSAESDGLLALMDTGVFTPYHTMAQEARNITAEQSIHIAMRAEAEAVKFYMACMDHVPEGTKKELAEIIKEEKGHLELLKRGV